MAQQALLAGDAGAFQALVVQMLDQDNDARKAAEAVFEQLKESPDVLTTHLLQALRRSAVSEHRSFCAVMLRKASAEQQAPEDKLSCTLFV